MSPEDLANALDADTEDHGLDETMVAALRLMRTDMSKVRRTVGWYLLSGALGLTLFAIVSTWSLRGWVGGVEAVQSDVTEIKADVDANTDSLQQIKTDIAVLKAHQTP